MAGIGIVGIGFMGMIHYLAARKLADGQVVAVCSRDPKKRAGDWTGIQGNFGPKGGPMDLSGVAGYADIGELLADPKVDLVDLCVPNDEHAALAIRALEAGKHVLIEKPIALTTADADAILAAAKANGKLLMVAHVLPFFPEFAFAAEAVRSGRYGALRAANLKRVIAKPDWSKGVADADRSGGPAIDLHIHDTHYIGLVCGVPRAVHSRGVVDGDAVVHLSTQYLYDDPHLAVSAISGALSQAGRSFAHGFEFYLEKATIVFDFAVLAGEGHVATPLSVILPDGTVERPELGSGDPIDAFAAELGVAVAAVKSGTAAPQLSGELARQALRICHAEVESVKTGQSVAIG
ncbi:Gfo/Idh/MocA family protein [Singulisphaera acidiphila]|uniref:Putative dehydrogenase n=1 Tax=Singulisphaera acidiphila (strain ATCC BAA-1392 / DSM 18658 / VKM B-2454 / MOB10) TaxID=886293 RepID=L0DGM6_SINAD|nr:Gfo/Idh/MocA family oxidoreductase [Singulisphaera acidiphila]AGA27958.1 putative dehydrogenase [Singulisphaera acidiphila DSM 18658]